MKSNQKIAEYLKSLKKNEIMFVQEEKFKNLFVGVSQVMKIQIELSKFTIKKKSKELGFNILDSNTAYGYYYGFCDFIIQTGPYKDGMKEIFFLWANVTRAVTEVSDPVTNFIDYFDKIQNEFLYDDKSNFYFGCKVGGQDAMNWVGKKSNPMGLLKVLDSKKL